MPVRQRMSSALTCAALLASACGALLIPAPARGQEPLEGEPARGGGIDEAGARRPGDVVADDAAAEGVTGEVGGAAAEPPAAPSPEDVAGAQALFRRGLELGTVDRWADALEHFRRSYARVPRPSTLFNIGVALGRLGRFVEAIEVFDELFAGADALPPPARAEAERLRDEALASLGEVVLELAPEDAAVFVDGDVRDGTGSPRALALDPGRHVLRATAPDHHERSLEVSLVAGERTSARIVLERVPDEAPIVPPPPGGSIFDEPAFWIVGGAVIVVLGVGIGLGVGLGTGSTPPQYGGTTGVVLLAP